jgi:hypothetical protein
MNQVLFCRNFSVKVMMILTFVLVCQSWDELERAEHEREVALRDELIRFVDYPGSLNTQQH